jgi:uncharacterized secreted protein with C-terminal beta-propeller domain
MNISFLLALALSSLILLPALHAQDEFDLIAAEMTNRAAVMKLPAGVRRVRLRVKNDDGSWKTVIIAHLEGSEGSLKLRLPDGVAEENCELAISRVDPFPYSAYQGASDHPGTTTDGSRMTPSAGPEQQFSTDGVEADGEPVVEESDIWKWRGNTLYFFNQFRGLQVIDVSDPAAPSRLATHRVASWGEKMYLHPEEDLVILLTYDSSTGNGMVDLVAHEATHVLQQRASLPIPGYILESRLIGNILYVVSRNSWQESTTDLNGTNHLVYRSGLMVSKIDLNDADNPVASPPLRLNDTRWNYWGAQVQATSKALLISTTAYDSARRQSFSTIHVVDISDPSAAPTVTHHLAVGGQVLNKFNLNLNGETLTAVSQVWRGTNTRRRYARVDTFDLSRANPRLGEIEFANNESITATRFVGDLLYVVTFLRIDPLFVIALSEPARPRLLSELEIPGFSTYLQPHGDEALLSIGVEGSQIAVSWFDISDPSDTSLASRVFIGAQNGWSWTEANWDEKALGFFPNEGLLLVPYQGAVPGEGWKSGVQLVELGDQELILRGAIDHKFRARRARVIGDAVVSISGRALRSLDISDRDHPQLLSELILAWPVDLVHRVGDNLIQLERSGSYWWSSSSETTAMIHVSPAADPDKLLTSIDLPGGRIAGSFLHHDCLFIAQNMTTTDEEGVVQVTFTTTVVDLGDPDRPVIIGSVPNTTTSPAYFGYGADYQGAILPDGTLLWYPTEQNFYFFGPFLLADAAVAGDVMWPGSPTPGLVYTLDISDKTRPLILARSELRAEEATWPEGEIRLVGATIYHGMQKSEMIPAEDGTTRWISRHWLGHLDLSDPANPVPGELVKLPGTFEHALGTPAGGTLLFTTAQHYALSPEGVWESDLNIQTLAFDGLMAFLIDELVVAGWRYGPRLFQDRFLVLGETDYSGSDPATKLSIYEWNVHGSPESLQSHAQPGVVYDLGLDQHLLIALGQNLSFIDFSDPSDPAPVTLSFPANNFWPRPELIEIHERTSAYLPRGLYGVGVLDFEDVFGPGPPPDPLPSHSPAHEWQLVPLAQLALTNADDSLMLGPLGSSDWSFCDQEDGGACMDYDTWARNAFRLAPGEPTPAFEWDTDGDGKANGWEYFSGTDPSNSELFADFEVSLTAGKGGHRQLTGFLQINPSAPALTNITPELSYDLRLWEADPTSFEITDPPFALYPGLAWKLARTLEQAEAAFLRITISAELPDR